MSYEIKIEKNVPLPNKRSNYYDVFSIMEVGDSFLVKDEAMRATISYAAKKDGYKFLSKKEGEKIRMWLIERS